MADQETQSTVVTDKTDGDTSKSVIVQTKTTESDAIASFVAKVIVGYFAGPKVAAILTAHGISVDPAMATIVLAGALHKIHLIVKAKTGYDWL